MAPSVRSGLMQSEAPFGLRSGSARAPLLLPSPVRVSPAAELQVFLQPHFSEGIALVAAGFLLKNFFWVQLGFVLGRRGSSEGKGISIAT